MTPIHHPSYGFLEGEQSLDSFHFSFPTYATSIKGRVWEARIDASRAGLRFEEAVPIRSPAKPPSSLSHSGEVQVATASDSGGGGGGAVGVGGGKNSKGYYVRM